MRNGILKEAGTVANHGSWSVGGGSFPFLPGPGPGPGAGLVRVALVVREMQKDGPHPPI